MDDFSISVVPIDCAALSRSMQDDAAGGFVSFEGRVRNHSEGQGVDALEYEVFHELAISEGQRILDEVRARHDLIGARAVHREGALTIGDCAVWIGVSARRRAEAFAACREIIDEIKRRLPIWKKEHYESGKAVWVNAQAHPTDDLTAATYYARQTRLPEIGAAGQQKLAASRMLVIGVGGLGSAAAVVLAGAGVGFLTLADGDTLEASNLHRQLIYSAADIGKAKAELAAARLRDLNPLVRVEAMVEKVDAGNVAALVAAHDIVLDCTDNFTAKYLLNDAAVAARKVLVQASIYRFEGEVLTIGAVLEAGCLRCLFPAPPPDGTVGDCAEVGILGTVPSLFGTLQANEAIKQVLDLGESSDMFIFDLLSLHGRRIRRRRKPDCPACGSLQGATMQNELDETDIDVEVSDMLTPDMLRRRYQLIDVREDDEVAAWPLPDSLRLPMSAFAPETLDVTKDREILLVCARGRRSHIAAQKLRAAGWLSSYSLMHGIGALGAKA